MTSWWKNCWILTFATLAMPVATGNVARAADGKVDFDRDIKPIFEAHCTSCHGAQKQKAALRLDVRKESIFEDEIVVAGDPSESTLYEVLVTDDEDDRMPQGEGAVPLSAEQIALIKKWIEQGAVWPQGEAAEANLHWAYVVPKKPVPPSVKDRKWVQTPIDSFVLANLEANQLAPEAKANKETLLRRVYLDLIGLPPSPKQIDAFVRDRSPRAFEKVVDGLLDSPAYGERWARMWLDMARYADSQGFEKDGPRSMWPYRDWVIDAFNADMPFDQFTVEQIAGDMLPNATREQQVASGFHANTMLNQEGGVDPLEARFEVLIDRVSTTGAVWLGSTIGCSQCHNHKYDPFSQKDFYRLMAFFDNGVTVAGHADGRNRPMHDPKLRLPDAKQAKALKRLEARIADQERILQADTPELLAAEKAWFQRRMDLYDSFETLTGTIKSKGKARIRTGKDGVHLVSGRNPKKDTYTLTAKTAQSQIRVLRLEAINDKSLAETGPGRAPNGSFMVSRIRVFAAPKSNPGKKVEVTLSDPLDTVGNRTSPIAAVLDTDPESGWGAGNDVGKKSMATFTLSVDDKAVGFPGGTVLTVVIEQNSMHLQHQLGAFRISVSGQADASDTLRMPRVLRAYERTPRDTWSDAQADAITARFRSQTPLLDPVRNTIADLKKEIEVLNIPTTLVMQEKPGFERPTTWYRDRGAFTSPTEQVYANTPSVLPGLRDDQPANRLGLARWLVSRKNPLPARVMVNRIWETYFGRGIVQTVEDFGTRGDPPSHPALLDWLATEFMDRGWSFKKLHRLIVNSATYQQSSRVTKEKLKADPFNAWVSRGPRFRVEAEMLRDIALSASGLLSTKMGGPPVMPPQPEGVWDVPYNTSSYVWKTAEGPDRFRRGVYVYLRRSAPYPMMTTFDGTSREVCAIRRIRTNTPLQALNLLNDPAFVEMARGLAERMVREGGRSARSRAIYGFRLVTGRKPTSAETHRLLALHDQELRRFAGNGGAQQLLAMTTAASKPGRKKELTDNDTAAWTLVANALLNLDEMQTKE